MCSSRSHNNNYGPGYDCLWRRQLNYRRLTLHGHFGGCFPSRCRCRCNCYLTVIATVFPPSRSGCRSNFDIVSRIKCYSSFLLLNKSPECLKLRICARAGVQESKTHANKTNPWSLTVVLKNVTNLAYDFREFMRRCLSHEVSPADIRLSC